jgi:hypothetical protein
MEQNAHQSRFQPTPHPVMQVDYDYLASLGAEEGWAYLKKREELIAREATDPFRHGFIPPVWRRASELLEKHRELLVMGGNRSGKTEWAAKEVIKTMYSKPGAVVWCFQTRRQTPLSCSSRACGNTCRRNGGMPERAKSQT